MDEEQVRTFLKATGRQPVVITPFTTEIVRLNLLEGLTVADATQLLTDTCGLPTSPGPQAVLEVAVAQEFSEPERRMQRLLDRVSAAEEKISRLVGEYRTTHEPLREGSLLGLILRQLYPGMDPDNVEVTSVQTNAPYDLPPNPWYLLKEGDTQGASARLREELGWGEGFTEQATAVLRHWQ